MEKPTYTAIDYNSKENKVIEERMMAIRESLNAERVIGFGIRFGLPSWI